MTTQLTPFLQISTKIHFGDGTSSVFDIILSESEFRDALRHSKYNYVVVDTKKQSILSHDFIKNAPWPTLLKYYLLNLKQKPIQNMCWYKIGFLEEEPTVINFD